MLSVFSHHLLNFNVSSLCILHIFKSKLRKTNSVHSRLNLLGFNLWDSFDLQSLKIEIDSTQSHQVNYYQNKSILVMNLWFKLYLTRSIICRGLSTISGKFWRKWKIKTLKMLVRNWLIHWFSGFSKSSNTRGFRFAKTRVGNPNPNN